MPSPRATRDRSQAAPTIASVELVSTLRAVSQSVRCGGVRRCRRRGRTRYHQPSPVGCPRPPPGLAQTMYVHCVSQVTYPLYLHVGPMDREPIWKEPTIRRHSPSLAVSCIHSFRVPRRLVRLECARRAFREYHLCSNRHPAADILITLLAMTGVEQPSFRPAFRP